jgi:hypothetical protein
MADFNWHGEDEKEDIIIPRVDAIAVYTNSNGDVVIRQQDSMGDEDSIVIIPRLHVQTVIAAINHQLNDE